MPYLTPEQLKEVENRTGTTDLSKTQFNIKLPTGEVIPAGINPAEAATIVLGGGIQQQTGLPNQVPTNIAPTAPTIPAANFPSGTPAPFQTKPIQTGTPPKPVPNTGSDIFQGKINGKIQTFTDQNAALAAGAIDVKPITAPTVSQTTPYTYLSGVSDLMSNVQIENLNKKIETLSSELAAGIKKGGTVQILTGLFEKFGIKGEQDILNQYNAQIFETTQRLRKIPDEVKKNLETLGVSENQLNRLIVKETQKPLEVLRDVMEQKGAAQERINQSLKFVGMFADAAMQDEAAKLEGVKFELETTKGVYKELKEDQRKIIDLVLDDRKNKLAFTQKLLTEGAPPDIISSAQSAGSYEEAMNIAAPFLAQQASIKTSKDIAPGIAEQIENMSDKDALSFIQKQAKEFNVDVNSLINMVEAEEAKVKPKGGGVSITSEDRRTLIGAGFLPNDITNIQNDVNKFGIEAVIVNLKKQGKLEQQINAVLETYGQKPKLNLEKITSATTQKDAYDGLKARYTENELKALAKEHGFAGFFTGRTEEVENFLNSEKAKELYIQLFYEQEKVAGRAE